MDVPRASEDALAQPTRGRLFASLVGMKRAAGTEELADRLGLHPNGVRRHLERLEAAGLIERRRSRGRTGRPGDRWMVASGAEPGGKRPTAYAELASWLTRLISTGRARQGEAERVGRQIGRELVPERVEDPSANFREVITALGFQPEFEDRSGGFICRLGNCPYRDAVRENADVICTLHRGITVGLLAGLNPKAKLERFEPKDPDRAGCVIEVSD